jgi:DNA modification methylase
MKLEDIINTVVCGDVLQTLKTFPDECVDMVITSPPYYGLRNYGVEGQIGLEKTFDEYLKKILEITAEVKRVLKPTGTFWLNMGSSYSNGKTKIIIKEWYD